jgi:signal transduction histidine kinase
MRMVRFRPRARIIGTIGERLISGPEAAIIELIKNAHDADASFVEISIVEGASERGIITVRDDGHGMSEEVVATKWMEPATEEKRDRATSPSGRRLLGSKGIGRFAAACLGRYLSLETTALDQNEISSSVVVPKIDWEQFEDAVYLDQVEIPIAVSLSKERVSGTKLSVWGLKDVWSSERVERLREEIRRLLSPISVKSEKQFRIYLRANDRAVSISDNQAPQEEHEICPYPILAASDYSLDGIFDEAGNFSGTFTVNRAKHAAEVIEFNCPYQPGENSCGIVVVKFQIFDREADAIRETVAKAGLATTGVREARRLLDSICGVAIYREGFRIRPYGDSEYDWLTLDAHRVQNPSLRIGRNQISGHVTIDDEAGSGLMERSSREGMVENESFRRLQNLIRSLLTGVVEPRRRRFRLSAGLERRNESSFAKAYGRAELRWADDLIARMPAENQDAARTRLAEESSKLTLLLGQLEEKQSKLEAQVTLGRIVGEVMHQGNTPLAFLENESVRLNRWWPGLLEETTESQERRAEMPKMLEGMTSSCSKLRALFNALRPLSGARRGKRKAYYPIRVAEDVALLFHHRVEALPMQLEIEASESIRLVGHSADLATALTNLVDNAIFWLEYDNVPSPKLSIKIGRDHNMCHIQVQDNGRGVESAFAEQVFDAGFSLKPSGTGLGLSIAREAIEREGGKIELLAGSGGASFRITLQMETGSNE